MRFCKAGGLALMAGLAAFTLPAHAQSVRHQRDVLPPVQRAFEVFTVGAGSRIGVSIEDVRAEDVAAKKLPSESGALITGVDEGTPAAEAGLRSGDVMLEFDGERVRSARQLTRLIQETPPGRQVAVVVSRDGQRINLSVGPEAGGRAATLNPSLWRDALPAPRPPRPPRTPQPRRVPAPEVFDVPRIPALEAFSGEFAYGFGGRRLGVSIEPLTDQLAKHFGVESGMLVTEVVENSAASKAGLRAGDVITKIDGAAIDDTGDILRAIGAKTGEVTIEIVRDRKAQTLKATIEAARTRTYRGVV